MVQSAGRSTTSLTNPTVGGLTIGLPVLGLSRTSASLRMYEQECALHDARGTGVAAWIARAEQALHAAILTFEASKTAA